MFARAASRLEEMQSARYLAAQWAGRPSRIVVLLYCYIVVFVLLLCCCIGLTQNLNTKIGHPPPETAEMSA